MRAILLTFCLAFLATTAFGQDQMDFVYLKNGQVVKGSIIKPLDADGVQIMTTKGEVYTFPASEVRRVSREEISHDNLKNQVLAHKAEGFTNTTTLGYGFSIGTVGDGKAGDGDDGLSYFAIHTVNGYHLSRNLSLGLGVGVEWYGDYELVPVYADLRYFPALTEWAPFFYGDLGYGLGFLDNNADGGILFGLGGGLQRSFNPRFALVASLGYRYQENTLTTVNGNAHFLQLSAGLKF